MSHQHYYNSHLAQGGGTAAAHGINIARRRDVIRALITSASPQDLSRAAFPEHFEEEWKRSASASSSVQRRCAASGIETQITVLAKGQRLHQRHPQPFLQLSRSIASLLPALATNPIGGNNNQYQEQKDAKTQSTAVGSVALSTLAAMLSSSGMERAHSKLLKDQLSSTFPSSGLCDFQLSLQTKIASRDILSALRRRSCGGGVSGGVDGNERIIGSASPSPEPEGLDAFEQFVYEAIYNSPSSIVSLVTEALLLGHDVEIMCPAACDAPFVPLVSFARDSVMTDLPEFTVEASDKHPLQSNTAATSKTSSLPTAETTTQEKGNVKENEQWNNNSRSNNYEEHIKDHHALLVDDEELFFPPANGGSEQTDIDGHHQLDADTSNKEEEDDDLFFPCSDASPSSPTKTANTCTTGHAISEGTPKREGAADHSVVCGALEKSNGNALSAPLVVAANIAFSPSLSVLPQLYTATLCSFLLHITAQPVLDYNQGPMGIVIGASQQQCHELCAILAPLAEQLQLVVHNVFGPIPLMPQNRRADIVVGTAVRICNGIIPTNHPRSVHHHHQQAHPHHPQQHQSHNHNNSNNKENPLVPLYWPCCSFPEVCPLDASPESAAAFHYYSLAHVSQLLVFVEDCAAEAAEEDEEEQPDDSVEEGKVPEERNPRSTSFMYEPSLEKAALNRIIGTTQRHQHQHQNNNNNNNNNHHHHRHHENSQRKKGSSQPLLHYEGPNKGILPTCQITIVRNQTRNHHHHHDEEHQHTPSSSLLDLHYQKPEVLGAAAAAHDVAEGGGVSSPSYPRQSSPPLQPLRFDLRSFDMGARNYDQNNELRTETLTMTPARGRIHVDEGQDRFARNRFVRTIGGKRQRSVSPTGGTTDPPRLDCESEEEKESEESSPRKLLVLYIHNVSTPLRWEQLRWTCSSSLSSLLILAAAAAAGDHSSSSSLNDGDDKSDKSALIRDENGRAAAAIGGKIAHPISKVAISAFVSLLDEQRVRYDPSSVTVEEVFSCSDTSDTSLSSFASADLSLKVKIRSSNNTESDSSDNEQQQQQRTVTVGSIENGFNSKNRGSQHQKEEEEEKKKHEERRLLALLCQKIDGSVFDGVRNVVCEAKLLQGMGEEKVGLKNTVTVGDAANSIEKTTCYHSQHAFLMRSSSDRTITLSSSMARDPATVACASESVHPPHQHHWLPFLIGTEQHQSQSAAKGCGGDSNSNIGNCLVGSSIFPLCREIRVRGLTSRGNGHSSKLHHVHPRSRISESYYHDYSTSTASENRFVVLLKRFLPVLELKFEDEEDHNSLLSSALALTELDALVLSRKHVGELISKVMLSSASLLTPRYESPTAASASASGYGYGSLSSCSSFPSSDISGPSLSRAHVDSAAHVLLKVIRQALCDQGAGVLGGRADHNHGGVGGGAVTRGGLHFVGGEASFVVSIRNKKETEQQFCGEDDQTLINVLPSFVSSQSSAFLMEVGLAVPVPSWQQAVALSSYLSGSRVPNGPSDGNQQTYYSILTRMGFSEGRSLHYHGLKKPLSSSSSSSTSSSASPTTTMNGSVSCGSFALSVSAADPASWRAEQSTGLLCVPMILQE